MTLRAVAWDVDGTLVDSEPLHHDAYNHLGETIIDADYVIRDLAKLPALIGAHRPATIAAASHGMGGDRRWCTRSMRHATGNMSGIPDRWYP